MSREIQTYFLLFIFYGVVGWIIEVVRCFLKYGKLINRGFLIGPYLPIYGVGGLSVLFVYREFSDKYYLPFLIAIIDAAVLEYLTSYIMEKVFGARWWDYSDRKFNIDGRICAENIVGFGFLSFIILYFGNPLFFRTISSISDESLKLLSYAILIVFLLDYIISFTILKHIKKSAERIKADNTEEMHKLVIETIKEKSWKYRRVFNAFPNFTFLTTIGKKK